MAASSGDDIPAQLVALLGKEAVQIRKTDETPARISVIDVIQAITDMTKSNAGHYFDRIKDAHPEVCTNCTNFRFSGRGQRDTAITDVKGIVEIIMLLPGKHAARVRRQSAELLCRYLGGDLALVDEVCRIRGFQEEMAAHRPEDPRRIFGVEVEASNSHGPTGEQMVRMMSSMEQRLTAQDESLGRIQERLGRDRQCVNLNVRAPKRPLPCDPPITRDIAEAGRPLPIARFLDQKEREDPTWRESRRSFVPTFGMLVQVLKKKKLKEEGRPAVYVEQNQRPQMLYSEDDRELMQAAWVMTTAHREDLVSRSPAALPAPVAPAVPRVIAMLQGGE